MTASIPESRNAANSVNTRAPVPDAALVAASLETSNTAASSVPALCLRFTGFSRVPEWSFNVSGEVLKVSVSGRFYSNQVASVIDACVDGVGIGRFMSYQVAALVATRRLRLVLDEYAPPPLPVNVFRPSSIA